MGHINYGFLRYVLLDCSNYWLSDRVWNEEAIFINLVIFADIKRPSIMLIMYRSAVPPNNNYRMFLIVNIYHNHSSVQQPFVGRGRHYPNSNTPFCGPLRVNTKEPCKTLSFRIRKALSQISAGVSTKPC